MDYKKYKMRKSIFITAVDTGVGKTLCACGFAEALKKRGASVGVYKPVLSGAEFTDGRLIPEDAIMLKRASGSDDDLDLINPYRFSAPVTPAHAASLEGTTIEKNVLINNFNTISARHDITIVEGAGGIMSPVADDYLVVDLIGDLKCPAIVVTDSALGRINHTLMTLSVLKARGIEILGVIVNRYPKNPTEADMSLLKGLKIFHGCKVIGIVSKINGGESFYEDFIESFEKNIDLSVLKEKENYE